MLITVLCLTLYNPVDCRLPGSLKFPRQEYWSGLTFPSLGDLPNPGIEPALPALTGGFFTAEPLGKPFQSNTLLQLSENGKEDPSPPAFLSAALPHWYRLARESLCVQSG